MAPILWVRDDSQGVPLDLLSIPTSRGALVFLFDCPVRKEDYRWGLYETNSRSRVIVPSVWATELRGKGYLFSPLLLSLFMLSCNY